jgi:hypothetical protein
MAAAAPVAHSYAPGKAALSGMQIERSAGSTSGPASHLADLRSFDHHKLLR